MTRLAFAGLGAMGAPMARRLLEAGHELTVWNRTPARAEPFIGLARLASSPAHAVRDAEALITMVSTPAALDAVLFGEGGAAGAFASGATLIEMSTVGPDHVADVAARLPGGVEVVDAPVLGSVPQAVEGALRIFVGASEPTFERWRPVLEAMGTPTLLGPRGAGAAMKLVANSTLGALMCAIGEALRLSDELGVEPERAIEILLDMPIGTALARKVDNVRGGAYPPSFGLSLMHKDLGLILEAAARRDTDLGLARAAERWFAASEADGLGELDYSAVIATIRGTSAAGAA